MEGLIMCSLASSDALRGWASAAKQFAEKLEIQHPAPKGAIDFERFAVSPKRYPDTKPRFSANCKAAGMAGCNGTG
jgi:hypothetical protein